MGTVLTTEGKYGNYDILLSEITNLKSPITDLKQGEYIYYNIDDTGKKLKCIVLYDSTSKYGIQVITASTLENVYIDLLGDDYNNAIKILNDKAKEYLNPKYAESARCVGSKPDDPYYENAGYHTSTYTFMQNYNGRYKTTDENYKDDFETMEQLGIKKSSDNGPYWLASRIVYDTSSDCRL